MNRKQFGEMLREIRDARDNQKDPQQVVNKYREKFTYAYVYSDPIAKYIFGSEQFKNLTIDLLNAILELKGDECIKDLKLVSSESGSELATKRTNSDIVAEWGQDRIVLEIQHEGDSWYKDRLVYYMARNTVPLLSPGKDYNLRSLYTISVQLFNEPLYRDDGNYLHSIQLKDESGKVFYEKQVMKLVEVTKFLKHDCSSDNCRLAQWLRAIDAINNESERNFNDEIFKLLQNAAKLSNFDATYYLNEAKDTMDYEYELRCQVKREVAEQVAEKVAEKDQELIAKLTEKAKETARRMLAKNKPVEEIVEFTELSEAEILALKN